MITAPPAAEPGRVLPIAPVPTRQWERAYVVDLVLYDIVAASISAVIAQVVRFGFDNRSLWVWNTGVPYGLLSVLLVGAWITLMTLGGTYSLRVVGAGQEEYRRVANAAVRFIAVLSVLAFAFKLEIARGFVASLIPLMAALTIAGRWFARRSLHRLRAAGASIRRVLVTGSSRSVDETVRHLRRAAYAGYHVVGVCVDEPMELSDGQSLEVLGAPHDVLDALRRSGADVLAVAGDPPDGSPCIRDLTYALEGTGVDLLVAPSLASIAGPRIAVHPVAGLPLLIVEQPRFSGPVRWLKAVTDRIGAAALLVLLSPVILVTTGLVRLSGPGPVIFRQVRVGRGGERFVIWKFRTMQPDAEAHLAELRDRNDHDGLLFKVHDDPRVTRIGRWLRRFSLDELPQLVQVLSGRMSLVGPRPPLPSEVEHYEDDVARRLLVKPGVTGLWQTSGRADLSWDEGVRLDLYYVENWSFVLDLVIAWKTANAVIRGRGAY